MISQSSLSSEIYDALYQAKETIDNEFQEVLGWITDIRENPDRAKRTYCEICGHSGMGLEIHHVRGRKYGNERITVSKECHKILTDKQRLWNYNNSDNLFNRGMIDICTLKHIKTGFDVYRQIAENLTASFKVRL